MAEVNMDDPSLSDLVLMWLNDCYPERGWYAIESYIYNRYGWLYGHADGMTYGCLSWQSPDAVRLSAADPLFFDKLRVEIDRITEVYVKLHCVTGVPVVAPEFTLAS